MATTSEFAATNALLNELLTAQQDVKETLARLVALVTTLSAQQQSKPPAQRAKRGIVDVAPTVAVDVSQLEASEEKKDVVAEVAVAGKKPKAPAKPKSVSKPAYITANWKRSVVLNERIQRDLAADRYLEITSKAGASDADIGAVLAKAFTPKQQVALLAEIDLNAAL